jgi:hypothetical protein
LRVRTFSSSRSAALSPIAAEDGLFAREVREARRAKAQRQ